LANFIYNLLKWNGADYLEVGCKTPEFGWEGRAAIVSEIWQSSAAIPCQRQSEFRGGGTHRLELRLIKEFVEIAPHPVFSRF
jgi:hypothetical protein